jgi:hypothetical protein
MGAYVVNGVSLACLMREIFGLRGQLCRQDHHFLHGVGLVRPNDGTVSFGADITRWRFIAGRGWDSVIWRGAVDLPHADVERMCWDS